MANFEFQSFWVKKVDFFIMERPFYLVPSSNFVSMLQIYPMPKHRVLKKIEVYTQKLVLLRDVFKLNPFSQNNE